MSAERIGRPAVPPSRPRNRSTVQRAAESTGTTGAPTTTTTRPGEKAGDLERLAERRLKVFELRKRGYSYRKIAETLGVDVSTAYRDVQAELTELREQTAEEVEQVKQIELERLDHLLTQAFSLYKAGDVKAGFLILKALERRSKYLGLDAPTKVAPTDPTGAQTWQPGIDPSKLSTQTIEQILREAGDGDLIAEIES